MLSISIILYYSDPQKNIFFDHHICKEGVDLNIQTPSAAFFWLIFNNLINIILAGVKNVLSDRTTNQRALAKSRHDAKHNNGYFNMFLHLAMVFMNFFSVMIAQCSLFNIYNKEGICHPSDPTLDYHSLTLNWIFIQVVIFYCNFFSMFIFLLLSRCFKFRTLREKAGLGGNLRNTTDFLEFC